MGIRAVTIPSRAIKKAKFIQAYLFNEGRKEPVLRHYSEWGGYHSLLLEGLLKEQRVDYESVKIGGLFCPSPKGERYKLCGAGRLNFENGIFTFWGCSTDYAMRPNEEHFMKIQELEPGFRFIVKDIEK